MKPWSITTTLRNPERLRNFLIALKQIEGEQWNKAAQIKYQTILIQFRYYGFGSQQFYNGLSSAQKKLIDEPSKDLTYEQAADIFNSKEYKDPAMRGRQSINPLKKLGLVDVSSGAIIITSLGKLFLQTDYDVGEIFFRSFLKWQIPNLASREYPQSGPYNIKPFLGTMHLIRAVNTKELARGGKPKGISKKELSLFAPTLIHYKSIDAYADKIIALRGKMSGKSKTVQKSIFEVYSRKFAGEFLGDTSKDAIDKLLQNLKDYGDNTIRYFRLTKLYYIRGNGYYIDLEPRRSVEINSLLGFDNAQAKSFSTQSEYLEYIADIKQPELPWETKESFGRITENLLTDISSYEGTLGQTAKPFPNHKTMSTKRLKAHISALRDYRRQLQDQENHVNSQTTEKIETYINKLTNIYDYDDRPILLEKLSTLGLNALNDAIKIKPNYPVGDDNEPTFTAPANTPDIECYYESFNAICEVTMLKARDQWYNEGQPVMRHLRDFETKHPDKAAYCLFIAPVMHRDTINTFWLATKYEYEGKPQKIVPLTIPQFVSILKILTTLKNQGKKIRHEDISNLYDSIIAITSINNDSQEWLPKIPEVITTWETTLNL